jgi:hypothetical protein
MVNTMKNILLWDVLPMVEVHTVSDKVCFFLVLIDLVFNPEDGGSTFI